MFALCLLVIVVVLLFLLEREETIYEFLWVVLLCVFVVGSFFLGLSFFFSADLCLPQLFGPKVVDRGPPLAMPTNGEHIRNCKGAAEGGGNDSLDS